MQRGACSIHDSYQSSLAATHYLGAMPPLGPGRHVFHGMKDVDVEPSPDMTRVASGSSRWALVLRI
jgi:hypothetical protein